MLKKDHRRTQIISCPQDKASPLVKALGGLDELNSWLGLIKLRIARLKKLAGWLEESQEDLFLIGARLAGASSPSLSEKKIRFLQEKTSQLQQEVGSLSQFVVPGGSEEAVFFHLARTVCRRVETQLAGLRKAEAVAVAYLNHLADFLFVAALWVNQKAGVKERLWPSQDSQISS